MQKAESLTQDNSKDAHSEQIAQLETDLKQAHDYSQSLREQLDNPDTDKLVKEVAQLKADLSEMDAVETERDALQETVQKLRGQIEDGLLVDIEQLNSEVQYLRKENDGLRQDVRAAEAAYHRLKDMNGRWVDLRNTDPATIERYEDQGYEVQHLQYVPDARTTGFLLHAVLRKPSMEPPTAPDGIPQGAPASDPPSLAVVPDEDFVPDDAQKAVIVESNSDSEAARQKLLERIEQGHPFPVAMTMKEYGANSVIEAMNAEVRAAIDGANNPPMPPVAAAVVITKPCDVFDFAGDWFPSLPLLPETVGEVVNA